MWNDINHGLSCALGAQVSHSVTVNPAKQIIGLATHIKTCTLDENEPVILNRK